MRRILFWSVMCFVMSVGLSLLAGRVVVTETTNYVFLVWNLILAALPYAFSVCAERTKTPIMRILWLVLWCAFLPNAPYIVTDFIHLSEEWNRIPMWYDAAMIGSFSLAGLGYGAASLFRVVRIIRRTVPPITATLILIAAIALSGVGVVIGRVLRWNSWDIFLNPLELLRDIAFHFASPVFAFRMTVISLSFSGLLAFSYGALLLFDREFRKRA